MAPPTDSTSCSVISDPMPSRISPLAGKPAPNSILVDVPRLVSAYFALQPDSEIACQQVKFGTSGHRGSSFRLSFNELHVAAITQAVCLYRHRVGISGPLFLGKDTHALSEAAFITTIEVLAANGVETRVDQQARYTPTPVISHAILTYNRGRMSGLADGIVLSPSHNPPDEGGLKYNPPNGGPAETEVTQWIEKTANGLLRQRLTDITRFPYSRARRASCIQDFDYITPYVSDLGNVVDLDLVRASGLSIGVDPLGGAAVDYWQPIAARYGLKTTVVNEAVDPTFRFMAVDWDGKIRMDCSSPAAMAPLIALRDRFDIAFANDTDADRHGIVCPSSGLIPPNAFLAATVAYLCANRPAWRADSAIGKTVVSSGMIDRLTARLGRRLFEVPVGFKWFSAGLMAGELAFGGEESAGATFLRRDGGVWTTDKDGIIMGLLAAEMCAREGQDPWRYYQSVTQAFGTSFYARIDAPASPDQKARLAILEPLDVQATTLAGETITAKLTQASGNGQPIGGIKVTTPNGWFAARPSGTEEIYKLYAESFLGPDHLAQIQAEGQAVIESALAEGRSHPPTT